MTMSCLGVLALYFAFNLRHPKSTIYPKLASRPVLKITQNEKILYQTTLTPGYSFDSPIDYSSSVITKLGSTLRYFSQQVRTDLILGASKPFQRAYLKEEAFFQYPLPDEWIQTHYLDVLLPFIHKLESKGVKVVIAPIPTKISVERELIQHDLPKIDSTHPQSDLKGLKEDSSYNYERLVHSDPHFVDLLSPLREAQLAHPEENIYRPMDTHWSSQGLAISALAVLKHLDPKGTSHASIVQTSKSYPKKYDHDFFRMLLLPRAIFRHFPAYSWEENVFNIEHEPRNLASAHERLVLVGTSYSDCFKGSPHSFGKLLSHHLGRELLQSTDLGNYYAKRSLKKLAKKGYYAQKGDLFIFEFPFRFPWEVGTVLEVPPLDPPAAKTKNLRASARTAAR